MPVPDFPLQHHQRLCQSIIDNVADPLFVLEQADGEALRVVSANPACEELFGVPVQACVGQLIRDLLPTPAATRLMVECQRCVRNGDSRIELQLSIPATTGTRVFSVKLTVPEVAEDTGSVTAVAHEISEWVDFRERNSADQFRVIAEHASDYIARYDCEGRFLYVNPALERLLGVNAESLIGTTPMHWNPNFESTVRFHNALLTVVQTGQPQVHELQFRELVGGHVLFHQVRFEPERNSRGRVVSVVAIARDITPLKITEAKLREREQEFRTIAENSPDLIIRCDPEGRFLYISPHLERVTGLPVREYMGRSLGEVHLARGLFGPEQKRDSLLISAVRNAVSTGLTQRVEAAAVDRAGMPLFMDFRVVPERDANDAIVSVLLLARDNTREKAAETELKALNATLEGRVAARTLELERANRDLQSFADTASHDLRAPLRVISGFTNLISEQEGARLSESGLAMLHRVSAAATKLHNLINGILAYSHAGQRTQAREVVAMEALAREVADELLVQPAEVQVDVAELPAADGDPTMLRQILQNLIGNAMKFSSGRLQPRIEVGWLPKDEQIIYFVRDNGAGFDMRFADKLCSMFQRLHPETAYPGSGVGLAIVKRLVERHGGRIWAESTPGEGATFYFTLSADETPASLQISGDPESVLAMTRRR